MSTGCGSHGECEQCEVEWDQLEVERMLAEAKLKEAEAQVADLSAAFDEVLTNFSRAYDRSRAREREDPQDIKAKEDSNWNSWVLHELKAAIRHAGYKKKERSR